MMISGYKSYPLQGSLISHDETLGNRADSTVSQLHVNQNQTAYEPAPAM